MHCGRHGFKGSINANLAQLDGTILKESKTQNENGKLKFYSAILYDSFQLSVCVFNLPITRSICELIERDRNRSQGNNLPGDMVSAT